MAPGVEVVLEVVRMAVNEQYPSLMPTLYPEGYGIEAVQHFERRWLAFQKLANITPVINGENIFSLPASSTGGRSSAPSGPRPAGHGRGQGRVPSQTPSWQTGSSL